VPVKFAADVYSHMRSDKLNERSWAASRSRCSGTREAGESDTWSIRMVEACNELDEGQPRRWSKQARESEHHIPWTTHSIDGFAVGEGLQGSRVRRGPWHGLGFKVQGSRVGFKL